MLNLSNVLQFVIHCLYYSPLPEKQFVGYGHQCSLHVALQFRYKLYAIHKEPFEKTLANVPFVANEFSIYEFYKSFIFKRFPVIHVTWCYHKVEQFSLLIAYQVKLESKEPAHGAFAPLCDALECLVHMDPLILAYTQRGTIYKADTCTLAQENLLDEHYQWDANLTFQFNETVDYRLPLSRLTSLNIGCTRHSQASLTLLSFARYFGIIQTSLASALAAPSVVGDHFWKQMAHVLAYLFEIEMLQAAIP